MPGLVLALVLKLLKSEPGPLGRVGAGQTLEQNLGAGLAQRS